MEITQKFNPKTFAALFDHTLLRADATPQQISALCAEAVQLGCATVCVNPVNLPVAARDLEGSAVLPITVVGFPLGAVPMSWKAEEARRAVDMGAQEIDMVMNVGLFLSGPLASTASGPETARGLHDEVSAVVAAAGGVPVKVIIETALLTPDLTRHAARICAEAGAAFVKTSTGFSTRGASIEDLVCMFAGIQEAKKSMSQGAIHTRIKASGGIRSLDQVLAMIGAGAHRIGSSNTVAIMSDFTKSYNAQNLNNLNNK